MKEEFERLKIRVSIPAGRHREDNLYPRQANAIDVKVCLDDDALTHTRLVQRALMDQRDKAFIRTQPRQGKMNVALWPVLGVRGARVPFLVAGWLSEADQASILLSHRFGLSRALLGTQAITLALASGRKQTNPGPILKSLLAATDPRGRNAGLQSVEIQLTGRNFDGLMLDYQPPIRGLIF